MILLALILFAVAVLGGFLEGEGENSMTEMDKDKRFDRGDSIVNATVKKLAGIGFDNGEAAAMLFLAGIEVLMETPCPGCLALRLEAYRAHLDELISEIPPSKQHHH